MRWRKFHQIPSRQLRTLRTCNEWISVRTCNEWISVCRFGSDKDYSPKQFPKIRELEIHDVGQARICSFFFEWFVDICSFDRFLLAETWQNSPGDFAGSFERAWLPKFTIQHWSLALTCIEIRSRCYMYLYVYPYFIRWSYRNYRIHRDRMAHDVGFFSELLKHTKAKSQWHWPSGWVLKILWHDIMTTIDNPGFFLWVVYLGSSWQLRPSMSLDHDWAKNVVNETFQLQTKQQLRSLSQNL